MWMKYYKANPCHQQDTENKPSGWELFVTYLHMKILNNIPNKKQCDSKENNVMEKIRRKEGGEGLYNPFIYYIAEIILEILKAKEMRKFKLWDKDIAK